MTYGISRAGKLVDRVPTKKEKELSKKALEEAERKAREAVKTEEELKKEEEELREAYKREAYRHFEDIIKTEEKAIEALGRLLFYLEKGVVRDEVEEAISDKRRRIRIFKRCIEGI